MRPLVLFTLLLLAIFATWYLTTNPTEEEQTITIEDAGPPQAIDELASGGEGEPQSLSAIRPEIRRKADKITLSGTDLEEPPFEVSANAKDMLTSALDSMSWGEESASRNVGLWANPCQKAGKYSAYAHLSTEDLFRYGVDTGLVEFAKYCEGLIDRDAGQPADELMEKLDSLSSDFTISDHHWGEVHDILRSGDQDLAKEIILGQLNQALINFDEARVRSALVQLISSGSEILRPAVPSHSSSAFFQFSQVTDSVAIALLCQQFRGCWGSDHPYVLRTCMIASERGVGCLEPTDIHEAIYQTQTPVEHMYFWSMMDQVSSMLAAYRRLRG